MKALALTILVCAAFALAACGDDDSSGETTGSATTAAEASEPAAEKTKPKVEVPGGAPPAQLETEDLEAGSGAEAKSGDQVTVQYVGVLYKNGKEFDSSWSRNEPFSFTLGAGEVIPGWEQGVEGMRKGGRRELVIPPELGYGDAGFPPSIPPDETLVFVIDLVEVN
jgi:peptidylprolyl isomerase